MSDLQEIAVNGDDDLSLNLRFIPAGELEAQGFGHYSGLFKK